MSGPFLVCDRCGAQVALHTTASAASHMVITFSDRTLHLCEHCIPKLREWISAPVQAKVQKEFP